MSLVIRCSGNSRTGIYTDNQPLRSKDILSITVLGNLNIDKYTFLARASNT